MEKETLIQLRPFFQWFSRVFPISVMFFSFHFAYSIIVFPMSATHKHTCIFNRNTKKKKQTETCLNRQS